MVNTTTTGNRTDRRDPEDRIDARLKGPYGELLLKIKRSSGAVELRGELLSLALALRDEPRSTAAVCLLRDTRLSAGRLQDEIHRFQQVIDPMLGERIFLVWVDGRRILGHLPPMDDWTYEQLLAASARPPSAKMTRVTQQAVKTAALTAWFTVKGRLGVAWMSRATGASMPTAIAAFRAMQEEGLVYSVGSSWSLADDVSWDSARMVVAAHAAERRQIRFRDPTGHARSPQEMAERIRRLQRDGVTPEVDIGGVLGAQAHYPDLDITGAPRLDLSVYDADISFVRKIDAGLVEAKESNAKAVLVLHLGRDPRRGLQETQAPGIASVVDCLADLIEIGLLAEAQDLWHEKARQRQGKREQREILW